MHSTNYKNTFIFVASDYPLPIAKSNPKPESIGDLQLKTLQANPYQLTSDDLLFAVYARRNEIPDDELEIAREAFFAKPQACLRASPLVKTMGYGVHHNENSKIAIYPLESDEYRKLSNDEKIAKTAGMRSKRA